MASNPGSKLTEEQYLAIERAAEFKSEFLDGVMYAMSGGSPRHADLHGNIYAAAARDVARQPVQAL